jgi:hypothetical protein
MWSWSRKLAQLLDRGGRNAVVFADHAELNAATLDHPHQRRPGHAKDPRGLGRGVFLLGRDDDGASGLLGVEERQHLLGALPGEPERHFDLGLVAGQARAQDLDILSQCGAHVVSRPSRNS